MEQSVKTTVKFKVYEIMDILARAAIEKGGAAKAKYRVTMEVQNDWHGALKSLDLHMSLVKER